MQLHLNWNRPIPLKNGKRDALIYTLDLEKLPTSAGVYIFGRRWGKKTKLLEAIYIGKANNIRSRVKGQLNNLRLMTRLKNKKAGQRIVMTGEFVARPGQRASKCVALAERALIRHFLAEGHDIVNKHGTRLRQHEIVSDGRQPKRFVRRSIYLEKTRGN
jgi:hypothetical protein